MRDFLLSDDLSGGLEVGASFRRRGHPVAVPLGTNQQPPSGLTVFTTETRNLPPDVAYDVVSRLLRDQLAAGGRLLLKKIDSTLRGPIGAELRAINDTLRPLRMILCPTNPAAGRTVRDGTLLVDGIPLGETPFRDDPIWPARESRIVPLLGDCGLECDHLSLDILRRGDAQQVLTSNPGQARLIVCDAETPSDIDLIVATTRATAPDTVLIGSNGLAVSLADYLPAPESPRDSPAISVDTLLILCGTRHPSTHRQVEQLAASGHAAVVTVKTGGLTPATAVAKIREAYTHKRIAALRFDPSEHLRSSTVQSFIAQIAAILAPSRVPGAYFFTGGESAWNACKTLGGRQLLVRGPWENAVVEAELELLEFKIPVFTKPGGYGDPDLLVRFAKSVMK
ncbi:MAG: hypothetical protein KAX37_09175 [Opitutaceae bacterium]|nr:hypothetical protein [Opitutaceae bacterium]